MAALRRRRISGVHTSDCKRGDQCECDAGVYPRHKSSLATQKDMAETGADKKARRDTNANEGKQDEKRECSWSVNAGLRRILAPPQVRQRQRCANSASENHSEGHKAAVAQGRSGRETHFADSLLFFQRSNDAAHSPLRRPARSPSTLMCSSISGHSMAVPLPKTSQFRRSDSVACNKRGYQSSGTLMIRPSSKVTLMPSASASARTAQGSRSRTKVVIPCTHQYLLMLDNQLLNRSQFVFGIPVVTRQRYRL